MCPTAIAYSMGQIIISVCMCQCICVSACEHSHGHISWSIFTKTGTDARTPKRTNEFVRGQYRTTFPHFAPQNPHFRPRGPENPWLWAGGRYHVPQNIFLVSGHPLLCSSAVSSTYCSACLVHSAYVKSSFSSFLVDSVRFLVSLLVC